ncbi:hypothetical protein [Paractinoplanes hotanensis]|uniref:Transposase n=1 Tax=Paractinoplanes hotanensis TaxID=2906497 RepID=A0ABT0YGB3_9ACTN|nr:hypothetical protein [Actinoplanes hotanensis]MCM4085117.1 hypothetical protein [Actinoplanes hotanensis]
MPATADESGSRLPPSFRVTDEMADWARQHAPNVPWTTTAAFIDYWTAQPGSKGRRCDWTATWRNWMRREQATIERHPGFRGTPVQTIVAPIRAARPNEVEVCSKHRGQRAGSCGLCRAERIAADTG